MSTTSGKFIENQKIYPYKLIKLILRGCQKYNNSKISNELNNLFYNGESIGKDQIQRVISKYEIIEEYIVKKIYPSTINIKIKPTEFIARLSNNDKLVGANGKLIDNKKNNEILPYIFGEFSSKDFLNFKNDLLLVNLFFQNLKSYIFFLQIDGIF